MQGLDLKIPPLAQVGILFAAMWMTAKAFPELQFSLPGSTWIFSSFLLAGFGFAMLGVIEFRKAQTTVDPRNPEKTAKFVYQGVYRFSRNPMYVGFLFVLIGWAAYLRNPLSCLALPVFVFYMNHFQIALEEKHLLDKFDEKYRHYMSRVRRWL
jgi:protein-S-isoprenylcysteine O-methyltransferase Ste14